MLKLLAAPLAGAAALLVSALVLGIDPLVSAIIGALVWAGVQLVWGPGPAPARIGGIASPSPGQVRQIQAAIDRIDQIAALSADVEAGGVAERLGGLARRGAAMVEGLRRDPTLFDLYRKALGNYLAQALELARRFRAAEEAGRADPAMRSRIEASLGRLEELFAAVEDRGAALDRIDLDARIAVLEAEIDADLAARND